MTTPVTFLMVKWGTKFSAGYANILHDMVRRNLPPDFPARFVCFTDNGAGLHAGIEVRDLPPGVIGWWNKLYLFKAGLFPEGERLFYLDLDTAITGDVSAIAAYAGEFATLRDFYNLAGYNSSLMLWRAGFGAEIWQSFAAAGYPDIPGGDQAWIDRTAPGADVLQDMFPGAIVSFKQGALMELPPGVRIVCFHGQPRPHEVQNGWVERVWKIAGESPNASAAPSPLDNVHTNLALPYPWLDRMTPPDARRGVCVVGGGASALDLIDEIKRKQQQGFAVWAVNGAREKLESRGVQANTHVLFGTDAAQSAEVPAHANTVMLYASLCHPDVFAKAAATGGEIILWHPQMDGIRNLLTDRPAIFIVGGSTAGMRALGAAYAAGFGHIHIYGFDSSFRPSEKGGGAARISVTIDNHRFESTPSLARQINEFQFLANTLRKQNVTLALHGDGLLPSAMKKFG